MLINTGIIIEENCSGILIPNNESVVFTKRSLKHILEKGAEGERLMALLKDVLETPDEIRKGGRRDRFIVSKMIKKPASKPYPHAVVLEMTQKYLVIVTAFVTNEKYLKDFEILWRTETL